MLPSRYPRWKPESPQSAEEDYHQHTNQGTTKLDHKKLTDLIVAFV